MINLECTDCGTTFQSNPSETLAAFAYVAGRDDDHPRCYGCSLKRLTGGLPPEGSDFTSAYLASGELTDAEWKELQAEFRRIDHSGQEDDQWHDERDYDYRHDHYPDPEPPRLCRCGRNEITDHEYECTECEAEWEERMKPRCLLCGDIHTNLSSALCATCEERERKEDEEREHWYQEMAKEHEETLVLRFTSLRPWTAEWWKNLSELLYWFLLSHLRLKWALWRAKRPRY